MADIGVKLKLTISPNEAVNGTRKLLNRKDKRLEVIIPAGVKTGTLVKLSGALQITDGYYGDIIIQIKVKSRQPAILATTIISGLFIVIICSIVIGYFAENSDGGAARPTLIYENGGIHVGGDNQPIELLNNPNAIKPTYAQLIAFIKGDTTDTNAYIEEGSGAYVCSDFAEDVHNNAEAAGIRAAWVGIDFYGGGTGHALNAFETIDRGLVYIDCLGPKPSEKRSRLSTGDRHDKIAYIVKGKEYGVIIIDKAESLNYNFYIEYVQMWQRYEDMLQNYNNEVSRYNQDVSGKVYFEGSPESARMEAWEAELKKKKQMLEGLEDRLGDIWFETLGVVEDINVHW